MSIYCNFALSFYRNIARQNCSSDEGLTVIFHSFLQFALLKTSTSSTGHPGRSTQPFSMQQVSTYLHNSCFYLLRAIHIIRETLITCILEIVYRFQYGLYYLFCFQSSSRSSLVLLHLPTNTLSTFVSPPRRLEAINRPSGDNNCCQNKEKAERWKQSTKCRTK